MGSEGSPDDNAVMNNFRYTDAELARMDVEDLVKLGVIHKVTANNLRFAKVSNPYDAAKLQGLIQSIPVNYSRLVAEAKRQAGSKGGREVIKIAMILSNGCADPNEILKLLD